METMEKKPAGMQKKQKVSLWHLRGYVRHGGMSEIAAACSVSVSAVTAVMKGTFRNQCVFDRLITEIETGKRQMEENQLVFDRLAAEIKDDKRRLEENQRKMRKIGQSMDKA